MNNKIKQYIPTESFYSVFDIDYNKLYDSNIRLILTDLDNTLISYKQTEPTEALYNWKQKLEEIGFEIIIVSNSPAKRVRHFANLLGVKYVSRAFKPLLKGYKKALKIASRSYEKEQIVTIGDQIMTDVKAGLKFKISSFLVKAIDRKTDIWITRINRRRERKTLIKISNHYPCDYAFKLKDYVNE